MENKTVLLFILDSINNIGDSLLGKTTEYLVKQSTIKTNIIHGQLIPNRSCVKGLYKIDWFIGSIIRLLSKLFRGNFEYKIKNIAYKIEFTRYYSNLIRKADKIILPVGMLKYSTQNFSYVFHLINRIASKYNKNVLMSAMSPQKRNESDWRYHQLVEAVNLPSVKIITSRDGQNGVNIIKSDYLRKEICCDYVGDPALWIPETFGIEINRQKTNIKRPIVGINIIRKGIFDDYNQAISDDDLYKLYVKLIKLIDDKGWDYKLFCNGMKSDFIVLHELQEKLGLSENHIVQNYLNGKEYAEMIANFDVVFGARLHSCITSVAVATPVVGFIWDEKLKYFSETMGISKFFFDPKTMSAEKIMNALKEVMDYEFDFTNKEKYKNKTSMYIRNFIENN